MGETKDPWESTEPEDAEVENGRPEYSLEDLDRLNEGLRSAVEPGSDSGPSNDVEKQEAPPVELCPACKRPDPENLCPCVGPEAAGAYAEIQDLEVVANNYREACRLARLLLDEHLGDTDTVDDDRPDFRAFRILDDALRETDTPPEVEELAQCREISGPGPAVPCRLKKGHRGVHSSGPSPGLEWSDPPEVEKIEPWTPAELEDLRAQAAAGDLNYARELLGEHHARLLQKSVAVLKANKAPIGGHRAVAEFRVEVEAQAGLLDGPTLRERISWAENPARVAAELATDAGLVVDPAQVEADAEFVDQVVEELGAATDRSYVEDVDGPTVEARIQPRLELAWSTPPPGHAIRLEVQSMEGNAEGLEPGDVVVIHGHGWRIFHAADSPATMAPPQCPEVAILGDRSDPMPTWRCSLEDMHPGPHQAEVLGCSDLAGRFQPGDVIHVDDVPWRLMAPRRCSTVWFNGWRCDRAPGHQGPHHAVEPESRRAPRARGLEVEW